MDFLSLTHLMTIYHPIYFILRLALFQLTAINGVAFIFFTADIYLKDIPYELLRGDVKIKAKIMAKMLEGSLNGF